MRNKYLKVAKSLLLISTVTVASNTAFAQCQNLVWQDEFDGNAVDFTNNWEPMIGDGCDISLCGWGNNELQYYKAENATVSNGTLKLTAKKERTRGSQYSSARLRTANMPMSGQWTNGRFEARIKLPVGQGLWPAFWMLPTDPDVAWPMSGEIDIMESLGQSPMTVFGTIHYGEAWPNNSHTGESIISQPGYWSDDFHTYAIEWTPFEIRWYLDDILYSTKTPADMANSSWWTFENYQYHFLLNVAIGGNLGGEVDDSIFPVQMEVDYVRVYDRGQPSIDGPHIVGSHEVATYSVIDENGSNSTYTWSVPSGAVLSGSGNSVQVDFSGATAGNVAVAVSNGCGTHSLTVPVFIEPDYPAEAVLDNFDGTSALNYTYYDGTFSVAGGVLTYTRSSTTQWDVIAANTAAITDAGPFVSGDKAFVIDFNNTNAALIGKEILIQLEDNTTATPDNYPSGRHSKYAATIQHANGWQTLRFRLNERISASTSDTAVNSIIILIDPNSFNGDTYVMDNIAILGAGGSTDPGTGEDATATLVASVTTGTQDASKGIKYGTASVTVTDNLGAPVASATVSGSFSGTWTESGTATTDANGIATFVTSTAMKGGVSVNFCVSSVTGTALPFDSNNSTGMCP